MTTNEKRKAWLEDGIKKLERLDWLEEGRTIGQAALQFILHEPSIASILPNIYDLTGLEDFATYDSAREFTDEDFGRVQALVAENFGLVSSGATS